MDAASNNSVDDIRELRESVVFAPVSGRHKVYILDEAHMLSQAAWNAFLKTLEEPPPHTVFVLATTEAAKVPATVVDRCHRFDFHRPTVEQIASVLSRAAASESIEIPPEAVAAIARSATGSFRDALGTLEQLVTYSGTQIELADVLAVLGVADEQLLSDAFDAVQSGDARAALHAVARCAEGGRDAGSFTRDLEARARDLLVVQTLGEVPSELSLTPEIDERLAGPGTACGRRRGGADARSPWRGAGGHARRRRPAHAAGAGAGQGRYSHRWTAPRSRCWRVSSGSNMPWRGLQAARGWPYRCRPRQWRPRRRAHLCRRPHPSRSCLRRRMGLCPRSHPSRPRLSSSNAPVPSVTPEQACLCRRVRLRLQVISPRVRTRVDVRDAPGPNLAYLACRRAACLGAL